ncbi:helix-turn-helix transcriptional regulator [Deferrisoma camini]|uniref:helix-turn-helix transcriptional regulator n=1 Tax=Deferrisoma camini TaxID=1035120 RepID=UPI0004BC062A|nr:helix-turn-helix transcriptional regulator [Deferrisoma camini]
MKPAEIYGHMMIHGVSASRIAREEGVDPSLVTKAIRGERRGPAARRVLRRIAREIGVDPAELGVADEDPPQAAQAGG